ncbi:MAG: efflux transporter outer membrane subunit, partial [Sedimentisphaerales bacterium]|nr:efflux transporter outer membrane subunit [Sedimentisphaerales bacterium]
MKKLLAIIYLWFVLAVFWVMGGCVVGPKYSRPETPADTDDGYFNIGAHKEDVNDFNDLDAWWERFGDSTTAVLVSEMLGSNYDLKAAAARVIQAQAALAEAHGGRLPEVSYDMSRNRSKMSFSFGSGMGGFGGGRFSVLTETWQQNISVAYMVDLFGKLKHLERAAWAQVLAAEANEQALVNSMIATVIKARIDIATIRGRLAIARANTQSCKSMLEVVEKRGALGLVSPLDVRLARENLEAGKALEPSLEALLITAHHSLDVLVGRRPGSSEHLPKTLPDLPNLEPVAVGAPAALLDRRPDVMAAEMNLRAANEQIGVSIAQLFPDLTLTAAYGGSADRYRDVWEHFSETYSAGFAVSGPIFRGGRLRAQIKAAKARYAELAAAYQGIVLTAMREVEDALVMDRMLQQQLEHTEIQLEEAKAAEN